MFEQGGGGGGREEGGEVRCLSRGGGGGRGREGGEVSRGGGREDKGLWGHTLRL